MPTRSPKSRPGKGLSRRSILDAALAIAQREGVEKLSVRRLTKRLGVSPMAVYRHFESKDAILADLVDRVVEAAAPTRHRTPRTEWRRWIHATFGRMYEALQERRDLASLLGDLQSLGPAARAVVREVLEVLRRAGFDETDAAEIFNASIRYTLGAALLPALTVPATRPSRATLPARERRAFRAGLDTLLDGVVAGT